MRPKANYGHPTNLKLKIEEGSKEGGWWVQGKKERERERERERALFKGRNLKMGEGKFLKVERCN